MELTDEALTRFLDYVRKPDGVVFDSLREFKRAHKAEGCWIWVGPKSKDGYGQAATKGRSVKAHRLAYIVANGPIPHGMLVMHACDNPSCVRPSHLSIGTCRDNIRDAMAKGRMAWQQEGWTFPKERKTKGAKPVAKKYTQLLDAMSAAQHIEFSVILAALSERNQFIIKEALAGKTQQEIAKALGISQPAVCDGLKRIIAAIRSIVASGHARQRVLDFKRNKIEEQAGKGRWAL